MSEQQRIADRVATFSKDVADTYVPSLEGIKPGQVTDMQAAADTIQFFDKIALELRFIRGPDATSAGASEPEVTAAAAELRKVLVRRQNELFPVMRRAYAAFMSEATSGAQTNFRAVGSAGKTLRGASLSFSSQAAASEVHQMLRVRATQFRFTKGEYAYSFGGESWNAAFFGLPDSSVRFED